ncbi:exo-beta-N-acetylmuramidase NamZ family protein [Pedobacter arcticus]|uniref:exo-beta-N-acetylmuramidase NamZ family protein n=1 Tax=Pedobacter arcticus TaxID=752140 RepID=UPI0003025B36|nr:DUF1343 domain-containing protein [Pedobacter arcticus]
MLGLKNRTTYFLLFPLITLLSCNSCSAGVLTQTQPKTTSISGETINGKILTGADQTSKYLPLLKGKRVGLVINQTAEINGVALVDTLKSMGIAIKAIFGPEHGFRGTADAGEKVGNYIDKKTGFPVISLYGAKSAPSKEDLKNIDIMVFDIQDVGARFYTYTITMAAVMQACADSKVPLIILDRPNPNGGLIDGPILDPKFKSGVGMHAIPIAHGLTNGEFAQMVNGQGWLKNGVKCDLTVIKNENYNHNMTYILPVKPSPNLPNNRSIYLYPSLCLFEGTNISQGRGTEFPFQVLGSPLLKGKYKFSFTPKSIDGMSKNPPLENQVCYGIDFRTVDEQKLKDAKELDLKLLIDLYQAYSDKPNFFNSFFNKLAGNNVLMQQIKSGKTEAEIRASWKTDLDAYKLMRKKYLLYN